MNKRKTEKQLKSQIEIGVTAGIELTEQELKRVTAGVKANVKL